MLKKLSKVYSTNKWGIWLLMIGSFVWSLTMIKSGMVYSYGMGFWGPNGHDGVWHIAISNGLADGSWQIPVFAGDTIKNYHIGFDLLLASLHKITLIPIIRLYFQVLPPIFAVMIGVLIYTFVNLWTGSKVKAFWSTFFTYFGGSFGWIVTLLKHKSIGGESLFWSQQSISTLINPPFSLSLIIIFFGLILLQLGLKNKAKKYFVAATFLFGVLVQIKVYAGLLSLGALLVSGLWQMFRERKFQIIKVFVGALIISILVFSPISGGLSGKIILKPFWFLETMMSDPTRINWQKYASAMINYKLAGNWIKGLPAYVLAMLIFIIGNFGTRSILFFYSFRRIKQFERSSWLYVFIYAIIMAGIFIPLFFVQEGTLWNTLQFMYYSLIFAGVLVGIYISDTLEILKPYFLKVVLVLIIVFVTIPTTVGTLKNDYLPERPPAKVSKDELGALDFLKKLPDGNVLTIPFNKELADSEVDKPPRSLYVYESTAYVSALSQKKVFLEDEVNMEITGYDWKERKNESEAFFQNQNPNFLSFADIKYLYVVNLLNDYFKDDGSYKKIFSNSEVNIYEVY